MGKNDWHWARARFSGPADRTVRFEKAAKAMAQSQKRNREVLKGGYGCPIIVEGKKDEEALRILGFTGPIEKINRGWDRSRLVAYFHEKYGTKNAVDGGPPLILLMDCSLSRRAVCRRPPVRSQSINKIKGGPPSTAFLVPYFS